MKTNIIGIILAIAGIVISIYVGLFPNPIRDFVVEKWMKGVVIKPNKISFKNSEWTQEKSFLIVNKLNKILSDVYILIDTKNNKTSSFKIELKNLINTYWKKLSNNRISVNYQILRFNCAYDNAKEFIVLKISQIDSNDSVLFTITNNLTSEIDLEILKYSTEQPTVSLLKDGEVGFLFEIPLKKESRFQIKSIETLMRKEQ